MPQLCLTEEESCMLMSSLSVNVHMCGLEGKKGMLGAGKGLSRAENGAVDETSAV